MNTYLVLGINQEPVLLFLMDNKNKIKTFNHIIIFGSKSCLYPCCFSNVIYPFWNYAFLYLLGIVSRSVERIMFWIFIWRCFISRYIFHTVCSDKNNKFLYKKKIKLWWFDFFSSQQYIGFQTVTSDFSWIFS